MKTADTHADYQKAYVIEQLEKLGDHDNDNLTYKELVNKLARKRALLEVVADNPGQGWF